MGVERVSDINAQLSRWAWKCRRTPGGRVSNTDSWESLRTKQNALGGRVKTGGFMRPLETERMKDYEKHKNMRL